MKYVKSAAKPLDRNCVNKEGLNLSKEVLWVSVGQREAELRAVKVRGGKRILPSSPVRTRLTRAWADRQNFFLPPTLTACSSAAL